MKLKRKYFIILISTIGLGLFFSCNKNDDDKEEECIVNKTEYVISVNSPATGTVNQSITIEVNFGVSNGCGGFGKFIESENGNTRIIEVEAKYVGCICTQDAPIRTTNYEFITNTAGDYELKFKSSPTEFITVNLTIN
ncbi:hypothetical protein ES677_14965 [Bizionia gelidisalsuginis]|uniref:Lipoprotein n=1 Tax=Bizionia gelidisalsuginis TaxID=291188 RepID=A0ABY3M6U0_9FLAO|nr:hypothetical protein [Bizionia gelidisalsuginis]TYC07644.1 hypothetical protein ES677_14965 [Bizionia gelidisalsuginis]